MATNGRGYIWKTHPQVVGFGGTVWLVIGANSLITKGGQGAGSIANALAEIWNPLTMGLVNPPKRAVIRFYLNTNPPVLVVASIRANAATGPWVLHVDHAGDLKKDQGGYASPAAAAAAAITEADAIAATLSAAVNNVEVIDYDAY